MADTRETAPEIAAVQQSADGGWRRGDLFHLCGPTLEPGAVIRAGNFGRILKRFGWLHTHAIREHALEECRKQVAPHLPSRLACAFLFLTLDEAVRFRGVPGQNPASGFEAHLVYRVRLLDPDASWFLADSTLVRPPYQSCEWPRMYWGPLAPPEEGSAGPEGRRMKLGLRPGARELLTLSSLVVEERFDGL